MRNKRAGLLALLVVVAATLLMVFFVLPRIEDDRKATETAQVEAPSTATQPAAQNAPAPADPAMLMQKLNSLSSEAETAITALKSLFSTATAPDATAIADAKGKTASALQAVADFPVPATLDAAAAAPLNAVREGAHKALDLLQTLPSTPADALKVLAAMEAALTGKPVADDTEGPADGTASATDDDAATSADIPPATASDAEDTATPAFDVLRVEPDGSTVIAGRAAPNTRIEILNGDTVIGTAQAGESGDFAAVLDQPLAAGDYQLVLKATGKDGNSVVSEEVATISVPKIRGGELLAMVTKPGEASRILTAPDEAGTSEIQSPTTAAENAGADAVAEPTGEKAALAPTDNNLDMASPPTSPSAKAQIRVTAVEIEGDKLFIAGMAAPKAPVIGYADDKQVGRATAGAEGHFVIEGALKLDIGDHTIRVDQLGDDGKVAVRASVPFTRPEGDQVSVVAQEDGAAGSDATSIDPAFRKMHSDLSTALGLLRNLFANGQIPADDALAASRSAAEIALKSLAGFQPVPESDEAFRDMAARTSASATKALSALQAMPRDAKAFGGALDKIVALIEDTLRQAPQASSSEDAPVLARKPAASGQAAAGAAAGESEPVTISQAPLTESHESVIIRRGDTLWQISRRIYGKGVRYTTIYLANKDNIDNPDRIRPGQIFELPKDARPDSEELHRKRLHGDQL